MIRLIHDAAFRMARRLVAVVAPALRPEEQHEAVIEFMTVVKEELRRFVAAWNRQTDRLGPTEGA